MDKKKFDKFKKAWERVLNAIDDEEAKKEQLIWEKTMEELSNDEFDCHCSMETIMKDGCSCGGN